MSDATSPTDETWSLTSAFESVTSLANTALHYSHYLMYLSIAGGVLGAYVSSGGAFGFIDIGLQSLSHLGSMFFGGLPDLWTHGWDGLSMAWDNAQNGIFHTGAEINMAHGGGDMLAMAEHGETMTGTMVMDDLGPAAGFTTEQLDDIHQQASDLGKPFSFLLGEYQPH